MFDLSEIKRLRRSFGMTQSQLAKKSGVSQSLVAKIESGRIDPSFTKARKLYEALESLHHEKEPKAADVMTPRIISAQANDSVKECVRKMEKSQISQLPVFEGNALAGQISESVIVELIASDKDISKLRAEDVMEEAPPIVSKSTPVRSVAELLKHSPLVLITDKGKPVGVVTKADLLKTVYKA